MDENINFDYGEYIKEKIAELAITHEELAKVVGCSKSTIRGYIQQFEPPKEMKQKIKDAFKQMSHFHNYNRLPAKEFSELVRKYLVHFKNEITEQKLAEMLGEMGQSQINKIKNDNKNIKTEDQYRILKVFLELCKKSPESIDNNVHSRDKAVYDEISSLINGWHNHSFAEDDEDIKISREILDNIIEGLTFYPVKIQDMILENHLAFFDSAQILFNDAERFIQAEEYITAFRYNMSYEERVHFISALEKLTCEKKVFSYYDNTDNWKLFEMVTHYRQMIKIAKERRISDPYISTYAFLGEPLSNFVIADRSEEFCNDDIEVLNRESHVRKFEKVFNQLLDLEFNQSYFEVERTILDEIDFRLTMSPMEWYVWMLIAGYAFAYQNTDVIDDIMETIIA